MLGPNGIESYLKLTINLFIYLYEWSIFINIY
jgi:hypothetical protein